MESTRRSKEMKEARRIASLLRRNKENLERCDEILEQIEDNERVMQYLYRHGIMDEIYG
jgi:hypothetical protein